MKQHPVEHYGGDSYVMLVYRCAAGYAVDCWITEGDSGVSQRNPWFGGKGVSVFRKEPEAEEGGRALAKRWIDRHRRKPAFGDVVTVSAQANA